MQDSTTRGEGVVIEWAPFRLRNGVTEQELLDAAAAIQHDFLERQPGFIGRELARSDDGLWADILQWTDAASARAAMEAASTSSTCLTYFHLMVGANGTADPGEGVMHLRVVRKYPRAAAA